MSNILSAVSIERKVQVGFALTLACVAVIGVMSYRSVDRLCDDAEWTRHSEQVISLLRLLPSHVIDAESAQRGHAITGDESFVGQFQDAVKHATRDFEMLRGLTTDNPGQQARLGEISLLFASRISGLEGKIELRRSQGFSAVQAATLTATPLQARILDHAEGMEMVEQGLLEQRQARAAGGSILARTVIVSGSLLALGVVVVALGMVKNDFARRRVQVAQAALAGRLNRLGAWAVEVPGGRQTWSDEVCAIHDEPPGSSMSVESAIDCYTPEFRGIIASAFAACVHDGTPYDLEMQLVTATGRQVWVRSIGEANRDKAGVIRRVQGALQDITERKLAQFELEKLNKQLIDASRMSGMAEIATNVLHNVGNVLNSANISTALVLERVRTSKISSVVRVAVMLRKHGHDIGNFMANDPKGKQLPAFLGSLAEHLVSDQVALTTELESLRQNVEHIKEIVAMQQNYATYGGVRELIDVVTLVEDSLRMNEGALIRHGVEVIRQFEPIPVMNVEKHKIIQILVNLVRNAKYACDECGGTDKRLTVRVARRDRRVSIAVADNGIGILPENLTRIFSHGFTTRKNGHGFGLHSGALAASEMGGTLTAHSDGPHLGATFTLELPDTRPDHPDE